ncbi:hypothetical protein XA68_10836 [Ophiocordyceps unilateralis]|uniref:Inner membrane assembly complex subunit 17 n=1 Tax=Ophiocordyceps unilateralis TaxID=268505 RepID=A0A2A9PHX6_OPHUN|nr:hypothetical protein XA68_10836 [Ophiocordyceps unilateralis]
MILGNRLSLMPRRRVLCWTPTQRAYSAAASQPGSTSRFYKTFSRPLAKTLLLAVFTYQLAYWTWAKLEAEEMHAEQQATIAELQTQVRALAADSSKSS